MLPNLPTLPDEIWALIFVMLGYDMRRTLLALRRVSRAACATVTRVGPRVVSLPGASAHILTARQGPPRLRYIDANPSFPGGNQLAERYTAQSLLEDKDFLTPALSRLWFVAWSLGDADTTLALLTCLAKWPTAAAKARSLLHVGVRFKREATVVLICHSARAIASLLVAGAPIVQRQSMSNVLVVDVVGNCTLPGFLRGPYDSVQCLTVHLPPYTSIDRRQWADQRGNHDLQRLCDVRIEANGRCVNLNSVPKSRRLVIHYPSGLEGGGRVAEKIIVRAFRARRGLRELDVTALWETPHVVLYGISRIAKLGALGLVEVVELIDCGIEDLRGLTGVRQVKIAHCSLVSDLRPLAMASRVTLKDCPAVADLTPLAAVEDVSILSCTGVTCLGALAATKYLVFDRESPGGYPRCCITVATSLQG